MKTNLQKLSELLDEEAVEAPLCHGLGCKNAALPDQKSCETHTLVGKVPELGDDPRSSKCQRCGSMNRILGLMARGFHKPGDVENRLGYYLGQIAR